jgi:hypothetical protein
MAKVKSGQGVLGFRVKSGWAVFALLEGSLRAPRLCQSDVINLSNSRNPETRQPYHAAMGKLETNAATLKRRVQRVRHATERSIADLIQRCADDGCAIHRAALVVGSVIDPESIANPHIRAHALEGRLFRTVLEDALRSRGIGAGSFVMEVAPSFVPKNRICRASCNGIELRLVMMPDFAYLTIGKPHSERSYRELTGGELATVLDEFQAIGEAPDRFKAFVDAYSTH